MEQKIFCRAVIHNLVVTDAKPFCEGSIEIDAAIMEMAQITESERVLVANVSNGNRMETYVVPAERGSGRVETSGSMSHLAKPGDIICVMAFFITDNLKRLKRIDLNLKGKCNKL
ncbi:MAG: aspartate 1-decarboxylase [Candidatus Aenigmarchaeota archaeon]|nr:aspartate 1-decarboxylase [Candidatus Aenigmarchaeota archaeon]